MASDNDDYDNFRIAMRVMDHDQFPSESEDMDNMRRLRAAGVPFNTPGVLHSYAQSSKEQYTTVTPQKYKTISRCTCFPTQKK